MIEESSSRNSEPDSSQEARRTRIWRINTKILRRRSLSRKSTDHHAAEAAESVDSGHASDTQSTIHQLLPLFRSVGILCAAVVGAILIRWDSQSTPDSQLFVNTDQFDEWSAIVSVVTGASAAVASLTWPSFIRVAKKVGRPAVISAIITFVLIGTAALFGPFLVEGGNASFQLSHFYLRIGLVAAVLLISGAGSFGGLALLWYTQSATAIDKDKKMKVVVSDILSARQELLRFFIGSVVVITGTVFIIGGLRSALNADYAMTNSSNIVSIPVGGLILYGIFYAGLLAFVLIPAYIAWQSRVARFRDDLYPVPDKDPPSKDWYEGRTNFEDLIGMRLGSTSRFLATAGVLAPLIGSIITIIPVLHS
jgi:hypothetical protein